MSFIIFRLLIFLSTVRHDEVNVTNFHTFWKDGLAFCAILRPDLLNYDLCDPDTPLSNLEMAMSVAEKELGIVRIIDPEGGWFQLLPVAYWGT